MKKLYFVFVIVIFITRTFATGEPSTYFNIYVPPNNDAVKRDVCLIITAIYDSTAFNIVDDGMDGDTDDSKTGILMAGQSYILYIRDNAINDDASGASAGILKQDGDYFIITTTKLVFASQSTDSDWQHDWLPSVNKKSTGEKFLIYAPKITSSLRDLNVFAYNDSTLVKIKKISTVSKMTTGFTSVNINTPTTVATFYLNIGEDIIYKYSYGRNVLLTGETYLIETSKPVTVQYGALYVNERDGGGYVPSSNGSSAGDLFYFGVPYQSVGEQEIRIVSWDIANTVKLERYSGGAWILMNSWTLNHFQPADWVGKNNGNASYPTVFRVTCTPGKKVSIFEGNWFETGSPGTSDMATMVSADNGTSAGKNFLVYMASPGNEQNVLNPFTGQKFAQRLTHIYLFAKKLCVVNVKDAYTNGLKINRTYTIQPDRYVDCFLTEIEWKNIYNGTGTTAGGPERPYLAVTSNEDISLMNANFNDNWMMYFGSALAQNINQTSSSTKNNAVPGDTVVFKSNINFNGVTSITNPTIEVAVTSGAQVKSSILVDVQNTDTINGIINQTVNKTTVSFNGEPTLNATNQYFVETKLLVIPVNNQNNSVNNTIISVETIVTGNVGNDLQQSVISDGLTVNSLASNDVTPPIINAPAGFTTNPNAAGCTATLVLGVPIASDNIGVVYTTNNAPSIFPIGVTTVTWTAYDAAGNYSSATQTINVVQPIIALPSAASTSICSGTSTIVNAISQQGTFEWYNASSGGSLLYTGSNFQTPILNTSTTYYVLNDINGCKSAKAPVIVVVKATPPAPAVNQPTICSGNTTTLVATASAGYIEWYDGNNTLISSTPNYITAILNSTTNYYAKNIANDCVSLTATVSVIVKQTPTAPQALGTSICVGNTASLIATAPGGNYEWYNTPTNGSLLYSGASYNILGLTSSQTYYVQTTVNGCVSSRASVNVIVNSVVPDDISPTINGLVLLGGEDTLTYNCSAANYATNYNWTFPNGVTILNGQGTRTVSVITNTNAFVTGSISVYPSNACGISNTRYLDLNLPSTIAGPNQVCGINTTTFSVHPVAGATNYSWILPTGMTGASTSNSIVVNISNTNFISGIISVKANSGTFSTLYRTRTINSIPLTPGAINGNVFNVCANSTINYSIASVNNATVYNWTAPIGSIIGGSTNNQISTTNTSVSITFPPNFSSGSIIVNASNGCYTSANKTLSVTNLPALSSPGIISGTTNVCSVIGSTNAVTYSISLVPNILNYYWTAPTNATITAGQGSNVISVVFGSAFNAGNISVASIGSCVNSPIRTLGVYKSPAAVGAISGETNFCLLQNTTATYSVAQIADATGYLWTIPATATLVSGSSSNSISVLFGSTVAAGASLTVRAFNSCGMSAIKNLIINSCGSFLSARLSSEKNNATVQISELNINEISPNPANESIHYEVAAQEDCIINTAIYNLLGQKIEENELYVFKGNNFFETKVDLLNNGVYFLSIYNKSNGQIEIKKFIKN